MRTLLTSALLTAALLVCRGVAPASAPDGQSQGAAQSPKSTAPETNPNTLGAPAAANGKPVSTAGTADKTYQIGPEDVLTVKVWNDARLDGQVLVRPDGRISLNLIDEVVAAGKTCAELQNEITERLKASDIIKAPLVSVDVVQINSKKYFISGEVRSPGPFRLIHPITVMEALISAGGFGEFADRKKIRILRMVDGKFKEYKFNWNDVIKGKNVEQNIYLMPGDQVIVPD